MAEENIDEAAQAVRRPPSSVLSEQAILAGLMIDNSALDSVVDIIRPEDFYRRDHRIIFEEIVQLLQEGHPADYLTVFESLKSKERCGRAALSHRIGGELSLGREYPPICGNRA